MGDFSALYLLIDWSFSQKLNRKMLELNDILKKWSYLQNERIYLLFIISWNFFQNLTHKGLDHKIITIYSSKGLEEGNTHILLYWNAGKFV